mmetsp:Transcript_15433/g.27032  ORF Transcript_15433/g.27032 Transcript_15433/m.27032 type:complete len:327 (+) Transcript_15433:2300-3280(+)
MEVAFLGLRPKAQAVGRGSSARHNQAQALEVAFLEAPLQMLEWQVESLVLQHPAPALEEASLVRQLKAPAVVEASSALPVKALVMEVAFSELYHPRALVAQAVFLVLHPKVLAVQEASLVHHQRALVAQLVDFSNLGEEEEQQQQPHQHQQAAVEVEVSLGRLERLVEVLQLQVLRLRQPVVAFSALASPRSLPSARPHSKAVVFLGNQLVLLEVRLVSQHRQHQLAEWSLEEPHQHLEQLLKVVSVHHLLLHPVDLSVAAPLDLCQDREALELVAVPLEPHHRATAAATFLHSRDKAHQLDEGLCEQKEDLAEWAAVGLQRSQEP